MIYLIGYIIITAITIVCICRVFKSVRDDDVGEIDWSGDD